MNLNPIHYNESTLYKRPWLQSLNRERVNVRPLEDSDGQPTLPPMVAAHHEPVNVVTAAKFQDAPPDVVTSRKSKRGKRHKLGKRKKYQKDRQGDAASSSSARSKYDVKVCDVAENTLALFHNALRHEVTTYRDFARPVVETHKPSGADDPTIKALLDEWCELIRFTVLLSRIEEVIANAVFRDVNVGYHREAMQVEKKHRLIEERVSFSFELFVKATNKVAVALEENPGRDTLVKFAERAEMHIAFAEDTALRCEDFVRAVGSLGARPLRYPHLEREAWDTLQTVCRQEQFSFTAAPLFRWSGYDKYIVRWMTRHTSSGSQLMARVERWLQEYTTRPVLSSSDSEQGEIDESSDDESTSGVVEEGKFTIA